MYDLVIRDATIVSSAGRQVADVAIQDGRIVYVGRRPPRSAREEMSAIGKFLMPGVIDTAVQFDPNGDPGIWERESRAAATGGVTTVVSLPNGDNPVVDQKSAKRRLKRATASSWVDFGLWGAATGDNADDLGAALRDGLLTGILATVGTETGVTVEQLQAYLALPGVLGVQLADVDGPSAREVVQAVRTTDRAIHLVHLSTAAELALIDPVHGDLPVTAGCTPHHLFLSTEEADTIQVRTTPPVRPEHDRKTLWTAVKRGRLDCIASDHHPLQADDGGVPGSELLFPLMLSAVRYGRLSLELLVSLCSESPARIFGLETKGRIAKGADADLILFSEGEVTRVGEGDLMSGAGWSPYVDREAAPKPDLVMIGGRVVARKGKLVAERPAGRPLAAART
ncbi:MAG: dihydroorotase family protein [Alphaproteobacteria bacterium]|nr:dihydroorotase family protein [Alphaproteobacteria bacterium]